MQNSDLLSAPHGISDVAGLLEELFRLSRRLTPAGNHSLTVYSTLASLKRHGDARLTALAAHEGVSQPSMTQAVGRLKREGLVHQVPDPSDGRAVLVSITDAGLEALAQRSQRRGEGVAHLLAALDADDQHSIIAATGALRRLIDAAPDQRPDGK